jgi:hypothetical protein
MIGSAPATLSPPCALLRLPPWARVLLVQVAVLALVPLVLKITAPGG